MDISDIMLNYSVLCHCTDLLHSMHRGDVMEIKRIGAFASVFVSDDELEDMGLSFDILRSRDISAKIFLAALRAQIMDAFGGSVPGDINVVKCSDGVRIEVELCFRAEFFPVPEKAVCYLENAGCSCDVYSLRGGYAVVPEGCDTVEKAKIKEHGRLICRVPRNDIQT